MAMDQGSKFGVSDGYFKMRSVLKDIFRFTGEKTVFVKDQVVYNADGSTFLLVMSSIIL